MYKKHFMMKDKEKCKIYSGKKDWKYTKPNVTLPVSITGNTIWHLATINKRKEASTDGYETSPEEPLPLPPH